MMMGIFSLWPFLDSLLRRRLRRLGTPSCQISLWRVRTSKLTSCRKMFLRGKTMTLVLSQCNWMPLCWNPVVTCKDLIILRWGIMFTDCVFESVDFSYHVLSAAYLILTSCSTKF